jgi:hypothetical protein
MRTAVQIALALVAIMALVAGVTYLAQYGPSNSGPVKTEPAATAMKPAGDPEAPTDFVRFNTQKVVWTEPGEGDFEKAKKGYHDLWFTNSLQKPIVMGLEFKNCKCTDAEILPLTKEQKATFPNWFATAATTIIAGMERGPLACVTLMSWEYLAAPKLFGFDLKWKPLEQGKKTVTIPAEGAGLLRIHFEGKKDLKGAFLVKARLWAEPEGEPKRRIHGDFELPINYVEPLQVVNNQINLETFNSGDEKSGEALVFSTTDAGFDLYAKEVNPSPLIKLEIQDLTNGEIAEYKSSNVLEKRTLAAKRVKVTVRERLSDSNRMDLGPFYRKILLSRSKDEPEEVTVVVGGEIRGELVVGSPEDRGRIDLKTFKSARGINKTIAVLAQKPNLELDAKNVRVFPENLRSYLNVRVERLNPAGSDKRGRWYLHLTVNPGFPPGKFPEGSAVFLQIAGANPPRQIRIPISGMAFQ